MEKTIQIPKGFQEFEIEFQFEIRDSRDFDSLKVIAKSEEEAIEKVKNGEGYDFNGRIKNPPRNAMKFQVIKN